MLTLHHLRIGRSIFTVWLLEELEVDYQLQVYLRNPETMRAQDDLKKIHPLGKSPVIDDDGFLMAESGAITAYLLEKYDTAHRLHPARDDLPVWGKYHQWLTYPEGSVFLPLMMKMLLARGGDHPVISPFAESETKLHLDHISGQLAEHPFILGEDFCGADIGICYVVSMADRLGLLAGYDSLQDYLQRCKARPAFERAIAKAVE